MNRLSLILVLAVLASSAVLAESGKPPLETHRLEPSPEGWLLFPPARSHAGGPMTSPSPRPVQVPSWDPRFEITDRLLAVPQLAVDVEARWDGRRLSDVRRYRMYAGGEQVDFTLSAHPFLAGDAPLYPANVDSGPARSQPQLLLTKGWRVDALSEGEWVDVRVRGVRGAIYGRVHASALDRGIAPFDAEDDDPVDPYLSHPDVTPLSGGSQPVRLKAPRSAQLLEERLRPWHVVSPKATLSLCGVHRTRPDLAWIEVGTPGHGTLYAFIAAAELVALNSEIPVEQMLREAGTRKLELPAHRSKKNHPPVISDIELERTNPLTLSVTVSDPDSGETVAGKDIVWSSDRGGRLGHGRRLAGPDLAPGMHHLKVLATDQLGARTMALKSMRVTVDPDSGRRTFRFTDGFETVDEGWGTESGADSSDGTGISQVLQGERLPGQEGADPTQEGSQARADQELLARCVAVQAGDFFGRVRANLEDLLKYGGDEAQDELRQVRLDAARAVQETIGTVTPAWDASDAALRSSGEQVVEILGSALTVYVENAKAGRPVNKGQVQALGDLRERIVAALERLS